MQKFDLSELDYIFQTKPLLFAGKAMEYYGLRQAGDDVDFIVISADFAALAEKYPDHVKTIDTDHGIAIGKYEFWTGMFAYDYDYLVGDAIEESDFRVISLEKLLLLKALSSDKPKNQSDLQLLITKIRNRTSSQDS